MNDMFIIVDALIAAYGINIIYAYFKMKTKGEIKENLLFSSEVKMEKCKDKEGYISYMLPKLLGFGAGTVLCGGLGVLNDLTGLLGNGFIIITMLFIILVGWFIWIGKKAIKMFW